MRLLRVTRFLAFGLVLRFLVAMVFSPFVNNIDAVVRAGRCAHGFFYALVHGFEVGADAAVDRAAGDQYASELDQITVGQIGDHGAGFCRRCLISATSSSSRVLVVMGASFSAQ